MFSRILWSLIIVQAGIWSTDQHLIFLRGFYLFIKRPHLIKKATLHFNVEINQLFPIV
jgi:hypothetical protein